MSKDHNLSLITLGAVILGIDYVWNLIPGLPGMFTLNRVIFAGVLAFDLLIYSEKYLRAGKIYLACGLIFLGCLPYLIFEVGSLQRIVFGPGLQLLGGFAYLLFFYVNCPDSRTAGRVSTVLMLSSAVIALYVLGSELGMFGGKVLRWRGAVEFTSAAGIFDPNIITLYYLPVFAFAPFLRIRWRSGGGPAVDPAAILYTCFCLVTFFFLNTRAGSLTVATALLAALFLRFFIAPEGRGGNRTSVILFTAAVAGALVYANIQYDLLGPIIGIWGETHLATDTSFVVRLASYRYLVSELSSSPDLFGAGYEVYWRATGWFGTWPHSLFVDFYIQGGLIFLFTYLCLFFGSLAAGLQGALAGRDPVEKSCFAGFFCFLAGFIPLAATLTIGGYKLPWAVLGCVLGLAAGRKKRKAENRAS